MTAQIHDSIRIDGKQYSIVGVYGEGMFDPASLGVYLVSFVTSCWRGYICDYKIDKDRILLDRLQLSVGTPIEGNKAPLPGPPTGPAINGVRPTLQGRGFNNLYENLNLEVPFTGRLLAGEGFIRELYIHMGFQPAWKFHTVLELTVENGHVRQLADASQEMGSIRDKMSQSGENPMF